MTHVEPADQLFPFTAAAHVFDGWTPPRGPFDPAGAWRQTWRILTLVGARADIGFVTLARRPDGPRRCELTFELHRVLSDNHRQRIEGALTCRTDALATPIEFTTRSWLEQPDGTTHAGSRMAVEGRYDGRRLDLHRGAQRSTTEVDVPLAANWGLFEAAQRWPGAALGPHEFTLLEHFDQLKRDQRIEPRARRTVRFGGQVLRRRTVEELERGLRVMTREDRVGGHELDLRMYHQLGRGIVPTVYAVDAEGRLQLWIAGLEACLLDASKEGADPR